MLCVKWKDETWISFTGILNERSFSLPWTNSVPWWPVTPFELLVAWFVSAVVFFFVPVPAVVIAGVAKASLVSSMLSSSLPCLWSHLASLLSLSFSLFSCTHRDCSTRTYTCGNARSIRSLVVLVVVIVIVLDRWGWHGDGVGLMRAKPHS